ncbi:unnamed protein product [Boreogadus saida]
MNRDIEKKRIGLRELSCRTASELPAPELPAAVRQCTPGAELVPKLGGSSSGLAAPADDSGGVSSAPEKGIVVPELAFEYSLRTDSDLGSDATATLQAFYYFARSLEENMDPTRKAVVAATSSDFRDGWILKRSCRASAEFPQPELLVRWSTKS